MPNKRYILNVFYYLYSSNDGEFYRKTIEEILDKMNKFLLSKIENMKGLIPSYIDMLALFISNINEKHIASITINQFKVYIIQIGKYLTP